MNRRDFLLAAAAAAALDAKTGGKTRLGMVHSTHKALPHPASPEDPLSYELVREMVWKAIEYGKPRAGSLEKKIKSGSWVVIKPNVVALRPRTSYRTGDITDMRVTQAVAEYVAAKSKAARVTIAEGGSYRRPGDPTNNDRTFQNNRHVDFREFDWGADEFPGWSGSLNDMLKRFQARFPHKKFDYVDLSYDAVRDASGQIARIEVPRTAKGVGGFGERTDYSVTNTITKCDFLISVPVMKVHNQSGITCCFKNYVGTAPREFYALPGGHFSNSLLHSQHSYDGRIDTFIADLAAFHPPDYNVVDALRGLQQTEHNNNRPDQMIRSNLILAGEDTVATDAMAARLMGFNPWDIDFLHLAAARDIGTMDLGRVEVVGEDPGRHTRPWAKPRNWYGRCNREWLISSAPESPVEGWKKQTSRGDSLKLPPGAEHGAAFKVHSDGQRKAFLWVGLRGRVSVTLNGQPVMKEESFTRYRVGQFQKPVELRAGENLLVFRLSNPKDEAQMSVLLGGTRNDGDTVEGIRYTG
jgi:uncharacterized protein (DUF362 family)